MVLGFLMLRRTAKVFGQAAFLGIAIVLTGAMILSASAADEPASPDGRTITIIIGSEPGGTTDGSARLMGSFLAKHLPGKPSAVVQSKPGAHSLVAQVNGLAYGRFWHRQDVPFGWCFTPQSLTWRGRAQLYGDKALSRKRQGVTMA